MGKARFTPDAKRELDSKIDAGNLAIGEAVKIISYSYKPVTEFSLKGTDPNIWQHTVWQKLFWYYVHFGCPIYDMHDMLCDFNNIQRLFKDWKYEFYWYFDPGYRFTKFDVREAWDEHFGIHVRGDESGNFTMRLLFVVPEGGSDDQNRSG